jgi:REP element-mobilizing transposase RayT
MQPATYYHIYNRANGSENLFRNEENYHFFLKKYSWHINPIAETYAYCLMPNHFHFLLRIKETEELINYFNESGKLKDANKTFEKFETFQKLEYRISKQFSNLFSSYTQSYNKVFDRNGSLFSPNFKKKPVINEKYLTNVIHYIHSNPVHHGFADNMEDWPHSSYHSFFTSRSSALKRTEVLKWFGGIEGFKKYHDSLIAQRAALEMEF